MAYGTFNGQPEGSRAEQVETHANRLRVAKRALAVVAVVGVVAAYATFSSHSPSSTSVRIESKQSSPIQSESDIEADVIAAVDRSRIREFLHAYTATPHVCGTPEDHETALYTAKQLESFGVSAEISEYYPLLSSPRSQRLAIVSPPSVARELNLTEGSIPDDACTTNAKLWPGSFLTYAGAGNVTAPVVYANFGRPADFDWLEAQNVSLEGKIAMVRYGGNFRGLKVMDAEARGMAGVIIYSDPKDDGFVRGPVYPEGYWRPEDSFQRGSVQYLSLAGGDPLTPGWAATVEADRLAYEDAKSIPHIPAMALSYGQAKHILAALKGARVPELWQGGLSFEDGYHAGVTSGDDAVVINLDLDIANFVGPIWNVVGTIPGREEPEKVVVIGNHRDAWTCGAIDPNSGSSVMLEIARVFGELVQNGWQPRRTIKFASWDGEEFGLLGSTEWAEDHANELKEHAIAYINVDAFLGNLVMAGGSPAIASLLVETAKRVPANIFNGDETETSLYEQWVKQQKALPAATVAAMGALAPDNLVTLLGSGSDFTAFYQHLGVVSANLLFMNSYAVYGTYHSSMDSLMYSETVGDPSYSTHEALARWWSLVALRLADDKVLSLDYSTYALVMREQLAGLEQQVTTLLLEQGVNASVNFDDLHNAVSRFEVAASAMQSSISTFIAENSSDSERTAFWNDKLVQLERYFLSDAGLPHRPWYKHVVFGPGFFEGYAGTSFPGIADAIAFRDSAELVQAQVDEVTHVVSSAVDFILKA